MPTASAKFEKFASIEACDPIKQIIILVEKKVRNLEKRKGKLDNYRNDDRNGKELNEDQKNAMKKYDQVIEVLEFAKELQKSFNSIFQESARLQKRFQKKESVERQQRELRQIHQLLLFQNILAKLQLENVQNDFLHGENGAVKLTKEEIDCLGEFYKIVSLDETNEEISEFAEKRVSATAEHFLALLEAKTRNVLGTTYKCLKDLLVSIQNSGYFSLHSIQSENGNTVEESELCEDEIDTKDEIEKSTEEDYRENGDINADTNGSSDSSEDQSITLIEESPVQSIEPHKDTSNHQLQDVLAVEGTFDFLQESQIDMESPHMDPAVVVAHPMAPPPNVTYHTQSTIPTSNIVAENETGHIPTTIIVPFQPIAVSPPTGNPSMTLSQAVLNHPPQDYDPDQPIPTQTFTNQNFVAMQNTMTVISPTYVPVTISATQHIAPVTLMQKQTSDVTLPAVHSREVPSSLCRSKNMERTDKESKGYGDSSSNEVEEPINGENKMSRLEEMPENHISGHYQHHVQNHQSRNFNQRGMRGVRGRNSANGYIRGRGSYGNGRGYYQNSYGGRDSSGSSTGYNSYRRGPRGGPRGGNRGGRGNYRPQQ